MHALFGTKVYDHKKQQVGILINTYNLGYVDAPDATGAKVLSPKGKTYPTNLDNLTPIEDIKTKRLYGEITEQDFKKLNIPQEFLN